MDILVLRRLDALEKRVTDLETRLAALESPQEATRGLYLPLAASRPAPTPGIAPVASTTPLEGSAGE